MIEQQLVAGSSPALARMYMRQLEQLTAVRRVLADFDALDQRRKAVNVLELVQCLRDALGDQ